MHMVLFGIMDFLNQRILKGPLVSGPPGAKHFSLPFLPPCSFPFWPPLFYSILFYSSPPHPQPILPVLIPGFFDGRWFLGLSCQNWEEKKVSQESMAVQMAALLLGACVCSCVHVCMYVYGHVFTCVRVQWENKRESVEASSWWPQPRCHGDKGCDSLSYPKKREW